MPGIVIKNSKLISGLNPRDKMQIVSFIYPERKKTALYKLYGKDAKMMLTLLCDKLIADGLTQQLTIEFDENEIPDVLLIKGKRRCLSLAEVVEIKRLLDTGELSKCQIAANFGVCDRTILDILNNKSKKSLDADKILNSLL